MSPGAFAEVTAAHGNEAKSPLLVPPKASFQPLALQGSAQAAETTADKDALSAGDASGGADAMVYITQSGSITSIDAKPAGGTAAPQAASCGIADEDEIMWGDNDAQERAMLYVCEVAEQLGICPDVALRFCDKVPQVDPECALNILKHCACDIHAAAAACLLGVAVCGVALEGPNGASDGALADYSCIFTRIGSKATIAELEEQSDCLHMLASDLFELASAANKVCPTDREGCSPDAAGAEAARVYAARGIAACIDAHHFDYLRHNTTEYNVWRTVLSGLDCKYACRVFSAQLESLVALDHPGGVLFTVIIGCDPCGGDNHTPEVAAMIELQDELLQCVVHAGGIVCHEDTFAAGNGKTNSRQSSADGSCWRNGVAGSVGNVVVAFVREQPGALSSDACDMDAARGAQHRATSTWQALEVYNEVIKQCMHDGGPKLQQHLHEAEGLRQECLAAWARHQDLVYLAYNKLHLNTWKIDLHGQSEETAVVKVQGQLAALLAMQHPGEVTFRIITGKGNHRPGQGPKMKPAVLRCLAQEAQRAPHTENGQGRALTFQDRDHTNDGVVVVHISRCLLW